MTARLGGWQAPAPHNSNASFSPILCRCLSASLSLAFHMVWVWAAATISLENQGQELLNFRPPNQSCKYCALFGVCGDFVSRRSGDFDLFWCCLERRCPCRPDFVLKINLQTSHLCIWKVPSKIERVTREWQGWQEATKTCPDQQCTAKHQTCKQ